jgi:hypothetical protein
MEQYRHNENDMFATVTHLVEGFSNEILLMLRQKFPLVDTQRPTVSIIGQQCMLCLKTLSDKAPRLCRLEQGVSKCK